MKPANAAELMGQPDIDGALVGGASLDADDFAKIVRFRGRALIWAQLTHIACPRERGSCAMCAVEACDSPCC